MIIVQKQELNFTQHIAYLDSPNKSNKASLLSDMFFLIMHSTQRHLII